MLEGAPKGCEHLDSLTMNTTIPSSMTVLVLGSGGREHALARAIAADPVVAAVHVAPGNPGTAAFATNHPVDAADPVAVTTLARDLSADLVVVGPEAPLVAGVADALSEAGIACFGPSAAAAQLEGSKAFAKQVMTDAGVPTARALVCTDRASLDAAFDSFGAPYVVKHDGLAAGKGVVVTDDREAAMTHGLGCDRVVVEEFLDGPEASLFVITDGIHALPLQPAQDFKRVGENDEGPNTGGMGAYSPLGWLPENTVAEVMTSVVHPTLARMRELGTPFAGLLYVGLAITSKGPRVVEFNARFGDPETEAVLPLLTTPLAQVLYAAATGVLDRFEALDFDDRSGVCVVLAADGYPGTPRKGGMITLPADTETVHVIHAGTALDTEGHLVAAGGRVLVVVATGDDLTAARDAAYAHIKTIDFPDGFCRPDIARKAIQKQI
ncbi:phosphoribosylamine-glycine ligase [Propionibacterium sp. oral taxon 192 str. F0372]|nr:phosphoribosylamine-glycine ligase [Propionibacterium sp. oral taxon 192 str. F0372]